MTKHKQLWGLPIIEPSTQTIGAALSVGVKPVGGGFPKETDRFHLVEAKTREREEKGRKIDYRKHDSRFRAYNEADIDTRTVFYGMLCYHSEREVWNPNYGMYRAPKGRGLINPKSKRFSCSGNGEEAERWMGDHSEVIECPGEACPFRSGENPPCRPRARVWFMPRWLPSQGKAFARYLPDGSVKQLLERPIMRIATQGREARDTFAGMLKQVREQASPVGFDILSWYGLPFVMALSHGKNPEKGTKWPDITFSLGGDWMEWIKWQSMQFRQLAESPPVLELGAASDEGTDPEEIGAEHAAIVPSVGKPAAVVMAPAQQADEPEGEPAGAEASSPPPERTVDEDPRSLRQMIEEDYVEGCQLPAARVNPALFAAGLRDYGKELPEDADRAAVRTALDKAVQELSA